MLITLVIILLLIGAAVVGSIYSNFLVFYSNFNESENYHRAYYNSISALERAELVTRQREPGYVGSGGVEKGVGKGTENNGGVDGKLAGFSYLGDYPERSTVFWTINSRTTRIPAEGEGDIEIMFSTGDTNDYNMMDYENTQVFLLYYDISNGSPYEKTTCANGNASCEQSKMNEITGTIRLPLYLLDKLNFKDKLNINKELVTDGPNNDPIVSRQLKGKMLNNEKLYPFTIYAIQDYNKKTIYNNRENIIRESDINGDDTNPELDFNFGENPKHKWSPINRGGGSIEEHTIISPMSNDIKKKEFSIILSDDIYKEKELRFSLLNLLKSPQNAIFPFLEYYVDFGGTEVSDKYFKIDAQGDYNDYQINKIIWKPTKKESILGSFTSIF